MIRMARENPGEITLCAVGPITNVAIALAKTPEVARLFKEVVIMGGTIHHPGIHGIPTPIASANFWNDPEAAQIVMRSGAKITLVGLDVTMKVMLTAPMRNTIAESGQVGASIMQIADFYVRAYESTHPGIPGCGLHDPFAVAVAEDKSLTTIERMCVDIDLNGALTRGAVIADRRRNVAPERLNTDVCVDVDAGRFSRLFVETLTGFGM